MKLLALILFISTSFQVFANDLTSTESYDLSTDLDNICGDTWCEGDFNWSVDNFSCDLKNETCTVDLTLIEEFYYDEYTTREEFLTQKKKVETKLNIDIVEDYEYSSIHWQQTCTITDVKSKESLFDETKYHVFSDMVYYNVLDCVTEIEEAYWSAADSL
ncbi:hypothetical protein [Halobacteriovorax sp. HLS]|uniref:hypothetical protein n=1 Tax=Halobacteriovorax sp. HLS TaxID=2234000 RepID=UPI000FD8C6A4|nr:hypothetical protein [Halobacteriovorax sp. HLS]